ncbi:hypothetical protein ACFO0N_09420 [Halobium salinum]|uniref:Cox cluster protein n=1 Tax=Halobium salinum TaxID=1364940 RepID=A0ABD5PBY3_9EURY|nr:hypothetical protein [Halobium salinum]
MSQTTTTLARTATGFLAALLATTLFAGVVGVVWRFSMWGAVGMGPHGPVAGPGFEFGFGVPLPTVLLWVALALAPFAVGYLLYALAMELLRERERGRETVRQDAV